MVHDIARNDDLQPSDVVLSAAVKETLALLHYNATLKDLTLDFSLPPNMTVHTDSFMLSTILRNLISNAIKFTPKGGRVIIDSVLQEGSVEVRVRDTGIGMSEDDVARLTGSEMVLSGTGTEGEIGMGLGLFLCRKYVEQSGGRLWAESFGGEGTVFHFTIGSQKRSVPTNHVPSSKEVATPFA